MIVDSSAIVAILKNEPDAAALARALSEADSAAISAGSLLEASIVIDRYRDAALSRKLDELLADARIAIEPVTADQARIARQAYRDFGKGSGHRAALNFGDCFAYALAVEKRKKLLFKGDDFRFTDITPAIA